MLGGGEGQVLAGALGEFVFDEGAGVLEEGFELGRGEGVPLLDGDPVGAGEIGRGDDAFCFEEFGEAVGGGGEGEDGAGVVVEVGEGEHFAAEGLVADPEDEVVAPLHGFFDVGEGEEIAAEEFGIHDGDRIAQIEERGFHRKECKERKEQPQSFLGWSVRR